jgi:secreted trypsin-like serine protease
MNKLGKLLKIITVGISVGAFALLVQIVANLNLSPDDSSALYGGILEEGYPSAGFLVSYRSDAVATCGYAPLNATLAITASHCVDDSNAIYVGLGKFTINNFQNLKVNKAIQKEGWVKDKKRIDDFAILKLADNNFFREFAQVASPIVGCNYRVVAYGRTQDPDEAALHPRKSAGVCVLSIADSIVTIQGRNSGICFGDSGSPIYYEGTNKVIGVIASIINPDAGDPCAYENTAIVVRADANRNLINENITTSSDSSANGIDIVDGTTIEVAEASVLEKVGLGKLENFDEVGKYSFILNAVIVGIVVIAIGIIFILLTPTKKYPPQTSI